jgi:hypothetical protein
MKRADEPHVGYDRLPATPLPRSEPGLARVNASTTVESLFRFSLEDRRFDPVEAFADYAVMAFDAAQLGV